MFLCTLTKENAYKLFGPPELDRGKIPQIPLNRPEDFGLVFIAETDDVSSYLALATKTNQYLVKQSSVPDGYKFTFRQVWGMTIDEETLNRIVSTLRAEAYPPMADYLDAKVKGDAAQEKAYLDACAAVKVKYPKFSF